MTLLLRQVALGVVLASRGGALLAQQRGGNPLTAADYAAASSVLEANLRGTVKNESVEPHWIGGGSFWYTRDEGDGVRYVRFDRKTGKKIPLFDHAALASALAKAGVTPAPTADRLGLGNIRLSLELSKLDGTAADKAVSCDLKAMTCTTSPAAPAALVLPSPDGKYAIRVENANLILRDIGTGRDTSLTTDGAPLFAWGTLSESSLLTIPRKKGLALPPMGVTWSPDGRFVLASHVDERRAEINPFVEWVPADGSRRPMYHAVRSPFTGDSVQVDSRLFVLEPKAGRRVEVTLPAGLGGPTRTAVSGDPVGWSVSRAQAFLIGRTVGSKKVVLLRVDLTTGQATTVVEETSETRVETNTEEYNVPNARILGDGAQLVWYSARSGSGQLYRYDAQTGALLNPITNAPGAVFNIIAIDELRREIYYTAGGREAGRDPYYQLLYRANLDRGGAVLMTDTDADHVFPLSPGPLLKLLLRRPDQPSRIDLEGRVFLDTYSTVSTPPITVLRSTVDGKVLFEVERADASALLATGWQPPVRERVKAADGVTDLWATYVAPRRGTLGSASHPVIDAVYGGPQVIVTPKNFTEAYSAGNPLGENSLARLGFAMVTVDGRGTPYRDNAFRDAGYPEFTQVAIDDHIAAIRQLAARHPEMDTTRVGIYGWSWGGTFTGQAILSRPEFYRVGVSGAGVYDYAALYPGFENFTGVPAYAGGSLTRTKANEAPGNWSKLDITALAPNLKGKLLIIYGDLDENVPASQAFRLIAALTKANKPYDLLYLPGRTHAGAGDPYTIRRTWDYFVEHLLRVEPPSDAVVAIKPPR